MGGFSLVVLIGVAFWGMGDSLKIFEQDSGEADDVNAQVVLGFGVSGIAFDLASFCAFYRWGKKALGRKAPAVDILLKTMTSCSQKKVRTSHKCQ